MCVYMCVCVCVYIYIYMYICISYNTGKSRVSAYILSKARVSVL